MSILLPCIIYPVAIIIGRTPVPPVKRSSPRETGITRLFCKRKTVTRRRFACTAQKENSQTDLIAGIGYQVSMIMF